MNKKELYECIMKNVAREVKKALNETLSKYFGQYNYNSEKCKYLQLNLQKEIDNKLSDLLCWKDGSMHLIELELINNEWIMKAYRYENAKKTLIKDFGKVKIAKDAIENWSTL